MPKGNSLCKSQGHESQPSLIPGWWRCSRCSAVGKDLPTRELLHSIHTEQKEPVANSPEPVLASPDLREEEAAQAIATTKPESKKARARRTKPAAAEEWDETGGSLDGGDETGGTLRDWKEPTRTRYEEAGEEERATRDRLYAWGLAHDFPTVRFQHSGGVPRMTYYPYIASGEPGFRLFRDHHLSDEIYAGVNFCQACDRGET